MILFEYPKKAFYGKIIPKNKIYDHAGASSAVKNLFVKQIDKIIWKYKLAPETINISAAKLFSEVQIFEIHLKEPDFKIKLLQEIDKAVPFPIIFEMVFADKIKLVAAYKRPSEADKVKWVISSYFQSNWLPQNHQEAQKRTPLPTVLNLVKLYKELLKPLLPHKAREGEKLKDQIARIELIITKEKELARLEGKMAKEKQFNFKLEINSKIKAIKKEIEQLL